MPDLNPEPMIEDALRLLVYVIAADHEIHQEEIESFLSIAPEISRLDRNGQALTREWLFDWFLQNYEDLIAKNEGPDIDVRITHLFIRLKAWNNKTTLLEAAKKIATSDGVYHLNEKVLISLAAAYWDI